MRPCDSIKCSIVANDQINMPHCRFLCRKKSDEMIEVNESITFAFVSNHLHKISNHVHKKIGHETHT